MVVPPLPTEITEHIIKQSPPPLRFDTFEERYRLLKTFSLVDSRWRALAQKELSRHLLLRGGNRRTFVDFPASRCNSLEHTVSLWSYSVDTVTLEAICGALERCASVEEAYLDCGVANERFWSSAQHLRSLTGNFIDLDLSAAMSPFNRLSTLRLSDPILSTRTCAWSRFLNPTILPSLRCLKLLRLDGSDFVRGDEADLDDSNDIFAALLSLAPQLEEFGIYEHDKQVVANRLSTTDWQSFIELQHLTVGTNSTYFSTWANNPSSIPPKLRSLTVPDLGYDGQAALYEELQGVVVAWEGGQDHRIILKRRSVVEDDADGAMERARQSLLRSAEERGIIFNEVRSCELFHDWEIFFDFWCALSRLPRLSSR